MQKKKVIVISDTHLGFDKSDVTALNRFLDDLKDDRDLTDLVLLGDIVDMWRRDASGVFLENWDVFSKILGLGARVKVHYVAGNHDYHVMNLKNGRSCFRYPFEFCMKASIEDGEWTYWFVHGHEFEYENPNMKIVIDGLCRFMSDEYGRLPDKVWRWVTKLWFNTRYFFTNVSLFRTRPTIPPLELQEGPEKRLRNRMKAIVENAYSAQGGKPKEILVFGHTHQPFVNKAKGVVNAGSWVTDAEVHNTYVVLSGGEARMYRFEEGDITDKVALG